MTNPDNYDTVRPIQTLIGKIDDSVFLTQDQHLKNFKRFDRDGDGYVSANDLKLKLRVMNKMNEKEIESVVKYLDAEGKGYFTFKEFHQKIKNDMTNFDENVIIL
jgi:Ca2+-binding EF-hand superfamily protein